MHDVTSDPSGPLDALLGPPPPADDWALRRSLLARTQRALRWRRRWRRLGAASALAACLALGMLTVCWAPAPVEPLPLPARVERTPGPLEPQPLSAVALEWRAIDAPVQQAELYREAGDRYLGAESDPQGAVRCYTAALDEGKPEDLNISAEDSWLLMAIKEARQKEKNDAK